MTRILMVLSVLVITAACLYGCKSSNLKGGTTAHETNGVTVTVDGPAGRTVVSDDRQYAATTQPSVTATGNDASLKTTADGGFKFDAKEVRASPTAWGLIGILALFGVAFYFMGNIPGVAACGAAIVLAFLYPPALVWTALGLGAWVVWTHRAAIHQLVSGTQAGLNRLPAGDAATVKTELEKAQSPSVKGVVKAIRAKL